MQPDDRGLFTPFLLLLLKQRHQVAAREQVISVRRRLGDYGGNFRLPRVGRNGGQVRVHRGRDYWRPHIRVVPRRPLPALGHHLGWFVFLVYKLKWFTEHFTDVVSWFWFVLS